MAFQRNPHFDTILEKLLDGWHMKAIAAFVGVSYQTVATIKNRFCKEVILLKDRVPNPDQGNFFNHFMRINDD